MKALIGKIGGRKFLVALIGLIGIVVAAVTGFDIEPYKETIIGVIGTYLLGQGISDGLSKGATSTVALVSPEKTPKDE